MSEMLQCLRGACVSREFLLTNPTSHFPYTSGCRMVGSHPDGLQREKTTFPQGIMPRAKCITSSTAN